MHPHALPVFPHTGGYPWDWNGWPPHLTPAEATLAKWYFGHEPIKPDRVFYDVPVDGVPGDAGLPSGRHEPTTIKFARMWKRLTAKRIDAIAEHQGEYQIIEFRPHVKAQTIGEVVMYRALAQGEYPDLYWRTPIVVAKIIDYSAIAACRSAGIGYRVAPEQLVLPEARGKRHTSSRILKWP